ncbi:MAG: sigma-70 family RNA polymerase sigma factor [Planctomycetes bacterium]|nr:sigma-70 family RNA polymerase sigma factor [Planctomycetota bacterium]
MPTALSGNPPEVAALLERAARGDRGAFGELFALHTDRLERMVKLRLDRRLHGRLDPADVLQEAYIEAAGAFEAYRRRPTSPFFLWLRCITARKLASLHRFHLGAQARDARREVALPLADAGAGPSATSEALAAALLKASQTSPSEAAIREETRQRLESALNEMDPRDREVLALRHFEQLTNAETAAVLGIEPPAASKRHVRALKRLKVILEGV